MKKNKYSIALLVTFHSLSIQFHSETVLTNAKPEQKKKPQQGVVLNQLLFIIQMH